MRRSRTPKLLCALALAATVACVLVAAAPAGAAPPPNDDVAHAVVLPGTGGSIPGTNVETGPPGPCEDDENGVWYRWTAPRSGTLRLQVRSEVEHVVGATTAPHCLWSVEGTRDPIQFQVTAGERFSIMVGGDEAPFELDYRLIKAAKPANDDLRDALPLLERAGTVRVSNAGAGRETGEPLHAGRAGGRSLWFSWTAPTGGRTVFTTAGSELDTLLAVYTGAGMSSLTRIASNDDAATDGSSRVQFTARAGATYRIAVDGAGGDEGSVWEYPGFKDAILLTWNNGPPPANDDFAHPLVLAGEGYLTGWSTGATAEPGEPDHSGLGGGASIWFRWTAEADGTTWFSLSEPPFNELLRPWASPRLRVYTGTDVAALAEVPSTYDEFEPFVRWEAEAGTTYAVAVDSGRDMTGWFGVRLSQEGPAPNDDFADAAPLAGVQGTFSGSDRDATAEPGEPKHAGWPAVASVWLTWTAPVSGTFTFDTFGSRQPPRLAVYTGQTLASLVEVASNPGWTSKWSMVTFAAVEGTTYRIAVDYGDRWGYSVPLHWRMGADRDWNEPTATVVQPSGATELSGVVPVLVNAADDTGVWRVLASAFSWAGTSYAPPHAFELDTTMLPDGDWLRISVDVYDLAGNMTTVTSNPLAIENRAPRAWADAPTGAVGTTEADVYARGDGWDTMAAKECSLDGGPYVNCDDGLHLTDLAQGDHVLRTRLVDRVGKRSVAPGTEVWTVDTQPVAPGPATADTERPLVSAPPARLAANVRIDTARIPVRLSFDADGTGSAIARYELQERVGSRWKTVWKGSAKSVGRSLVPGRTHRFRLRAADATGNVSAWALGTPLLARAVQETRSTAAGPWKRTKIRSAHGGALAHSQARGAWRQLTFTGSEIALVSPTGPRRGKAQVLVDGRPVATVDLYSAQERVRRVVFRHEFDTPGRHTVRVVVLGQRNSRSAGRRVDVDAFVVLG